MRNLKFLTGNLITGGDINAATLSDGAWNAGRLQNLLERLCRGGRCRDSGKAPGRIERDKIHVGIESSEQCGKQCGLRRRIVGAGNQRLDVMRIAQHVREDARRNARIGRAELDMAAASRPTLQPAAERIISACRS